MSFAWKVNPFFALINCMHKKFSPGHSKLRNKLRGKARGLVLSPAFAGTKKSAKESPALRQAFHSALFVLLFLFPRRCLFGRAAQPTVANFAGVIVLCNAKGKENPLHISLPRSYRHCFSLAGIIGELAVNMPFIFRTIIIAIHNTHSVVQLKAIPKAKSASWKTLQNPPFLYFHPNSRRQKDLLARSQGKIHRGEKIISGRAR